MSLLPTPHDPATNATWAEALNAWLTQDHALDGRHNQGASFEYFGGAPAGTLAQQTNAWNAYLSWASSNGGGLCLFGPYRYQHLPSLMDIPSYGGILGVGWSTVLELDSTVTGHGVATHISSNGTTDPNGIYPYLAHFYVDMSKISPGTVNGSGVRSAAGTQDGVHIETNPTSGSGGNSTRRFSFDNDQNTLIDHVFVWAATRDGIALVGKGENNVSNCRVYSSGRYGYKTTFDTNFVACTTGGSGDHGFDIESSSVRATASKAWYSGQLTNGAGWRFFGITSGNVQLTGCEAQDNKGAGFLVDSCTSGVSITGTADSNSTASAGTVPALDIWASTDVQAHLSCTDRNSGGVTTQTHALRVRSTSNNNQIYLEHRGVNGATVSTPIDTSSDFTTCKTNTIFVNGSGGRQNPVFATSFTPDPTAGGSIAITLTGNITINAPVNGNYWPGCRMLLALTQDSAGSHTIAWNATYKTPPTATLTLNTTTSAEFEYNGTIWRLIGWRTGDL